MTDMELIELLRLQAKEISDDGHAERGNTIQRAADRLEFYLVDALKRLTEELA